MQITYEQFKKLSKDLLINLKKDNKVSHSKILESFSKTLGYKDFNSLSAKFKAEEDSNTK